MPTKLTQVKPKVKPFFRGNEAKEPTGWKAVLADILADIERLKRLVPIVERKIRKRESWPGESAT
jgi:hypothetical protein